MHWLAPLLEGAAAELRLQSSECEHENALAVPAPNMEAHCWQLWWEATRLLKGGMWQAVNKGCLVLLVSAQETCIPLNCLKGKLRQPYHHEVVPELLLLRACCCLLVLLVLLLRGCHGATSHASVSSEVDSERK